MKEVWSFEFRKMRGISLLPEGLLPSEEELCSMELAGLFV